MAILNPIREIIDGPDFQPELDLAEKKLLAALCLALPGDDWTIFVQPFLNGLHPDFVLFNPKYGITIVEVKDLTYVSYSVSENGAVANNNESGRPDKSAFDQVTEYKKHLIDLEAPILREQIELYGDRWFGAVKCAAYFEGYDAQRSSDYWSTHVKSNKDRSYVKIIGDDDLRLENRSRLLQKLRADKATSFSDFLSRDEFVGSLFAALGHPDLGELNAKAVRKLGMEQRAFSTSKPEFKHIKGAAGSGKTIILANRIVDALAAGKVVLATCYNITMRNYLRDVVAIARRERKIQRVGDGQLEFDHFHRLLQRIKTTLKLQGDGAQEEEISSGNEDEDHWKRLAKDVHLALARRSPQERVDAGLAIYDTIMIDEGQDFDPEWVETLKLLFKPGIKPEMVVMSDPAQNIYDRGVSRAPSLAGFDGRPPVLRKTYRLKGRLADVAKLWLERMVVGEQETVPVFQRELFGEIRWTDSSLRDDPVSFVLESVKYRQAQQVAWPDIAIIAPNKQLCRNIYAVLEAKGIPVSITATSPSEHAAILAECGGEGNDGLREMNAGQRKCVKWKEERIEQSRKLAFGRKTGKLKITTIHSFKGWEWSHVIVVLEATNSPPAKTNALAYTALTRPLQTLHVINCIPEFCRFGKLLGEEALLSQ